MVVFGLCMLLKGSLFIYVIFSIIVGGVSAIILFGIGYSLMPNNMKFGVLIGVIIVSILLGAVIGYLSFKFSEAWASTALSGFGGIVVFGILGKALKLKASLNFVLLVIGAFIGLFLGRKFKNFVNSTCTSIIGAFLIVRGIGCYAPGYPNELGVANSAA